MTAKEVIELVLALLGFVIIVVCYGRQQAAHGQIVVVSLDVAALHIEIGETQARHDGLG